MKQPYRKSRTKWRSIFRSRLWGFWMLLPSMAGTAAFHVLPMFQVLKQSVTDDRSGGFAGWEHYREVLDNGSFRLAAQNTVRFLGVCVPLLLALSLLGALLFYREKGDLRKTLALLPMAIPVASMARIWKVLFRRYGLLDRLFCGRTGGVDYIGSRWAFGVLVLTYIWRNVGYDIILWTAAVRSVNRELDEAAQVDGAGRAQRFVRIWLPHILPYAGVILLLSLLNAFKAFREVYLMAGEYPNKTIYLLQHIFNNWLLHYRFTDLCAGAVLVIGAVGILSVLFQRLLERDGESGGDE